MDIFKNNSEVDNFMILSVRHFFLLIQIFARSQTILEEHCDLLHDKRTLETVLLYQKSLLYYSFQITCG